MSEVKLNERERLIENILRMTSSEIETVAKMVEVAHAYAATTISPDEFERVLTKVLALYNDPNWGDEGISTNELERRNRLDRAAIEAVRGEPTRPLEDVLRDLDIE
jgi:hypothetical protein